MKLDDRNLAVGLTGPDVALLQSELKQIGYDISEAEVKAQTFGPATEKTVFLFQRVTGLTVSGVVDEKTAAAINAAVQAKRKQGFLVRGYVRSAAGKPAVGTAVHAYDRDLRSEQLLGRATTNDQGQYQIGYKPEQFRRAEKGSADLRVAAIGADDKEIASSHVIYNAGPVMEVNLVVGGEDNRGQSEYELLLAEVAPLLQGVPIADLTEDLKHQDLTFLTGETGRDPQLLAFVVLAHRHAREVEIPADIFYGLFRQRMPTGLGELLNQSVEMLKRALGLSIAANIIPARTSGEIDRIFDRFRKIRAQRASAPGADRPAFADLLATAKLDSKQQQTFLSEWVNHTGSIEDFWKKIRSHQDLFQIAGRAELALSLGTLTNHHAPLVTALMEAGGPLTITRASDLARLDEGAWVDLIVASNSGVPADVPGKDAQARTRAYAHALARMVEDQFPTAVLANRLERDRPAGFASTARFLRANPDFELSHSRLENYLADHPQAMNAIPAAEREQCRTQLKSMQRLYKISPRYEVARALMADGLHSAFGISRQGETMFVLNYSTIMGGAQEARAYYFKAKQTAATSLALLAEYGPGFSKVSTNAAPEVTLEDVEGIPDWRSLFGSLDLCDCEGCRSVLGPAAYFVDVLHFLKDRRLIDQIQRDGSGSITGVTYRHVGPVEQSAKHALFARRPDLGDIELTCENTNTPLPYIDLVNEILENYVSPFPAFAPFDLAGGLAADLDSRTVSAALRAAFVPPLSEYATINVRKPGEWWTIAELSFVYTVRLNSGVPRVVARSLQTSGTPQERAANPQYINPAAYDLLRQQVYPWTLPFHLSSAETATHLEHLGVKRHQVIEAFLPGDRATLLADGSVAREYLGLTVEQAALITATTTSQHGAASPGPWNLYGFAQATLSALQPIPDPADASAWISAGNWLVVLTGRIDVFLQQSGLEYRDLLDVLSTYRVNPLIGGVRPITIQSTDPEVQDTCDTSKLAIAGMDEDEAAALRLMRFVRLWRALGWSIFELDRAFTAFNPAGEDDFLTQISHVQRLHDRLETQIDRLLTFWAPIDTAFYIDHRAAGQPAVASLYARLFRNRAVTNPVDSAFTENPAALAGSLSDRAATIQAALGLTSDELALLIADASVVPGDVLSLDNLSRLCRHATLARGLKIPVREYLTALALTGDDPFASTLATVLFVERIKKIGAAGFTTTEIDYLLRHELIPGSVVAPTDDEIALVLDGLRSGLAKVAADNTFHDDPADPAGLTTDPDGKLTAQKLALLNWDAGWIEQVVAAMNGQVTYRAPLAALPPGIALPNDSGSYEVQLAALPGGFVVPADVAAIVGFDAATQAFRSVRALTAAERDTLIAASLEPAYLSAVAALYQQPSELQGDIAYASSTSELTFAGPMTLARRARLLAESADPPYQAAVVALFQAPRDFVDRDMRSFPVSVFTTPLAALPAVVRFPASLKMRIVYDPTAATLRFSGIMTSAERDTLLGLSTDNLDPNHAAYQAAIQALYDAPMALAPAPTDTFLTAAGPTPDTATLFDGDVTPAVRFEALLQKLLPYLSVTLGRRMVIQKLAETLMLEARVAEALLTRWIHSGGEPAVSAFLHPAFASSDPGIPISRASFPAQFDAYTLLDKVALIVNRQKITNQQLNWLCAYRLTAGDPTAQWLDLNSLPIQAGGAAASFNAWERVMDLFALRDALPQGENLLSGLFGLARTGAVTDAQIHQYLSDRTRWSVANLQFLTGVLGFNLAVPAAFQQERAMMQLADCFLLMSRLALSAEQCRALSAPDVTDDVSRDVKNAVRARYEEQQWLELAQPLRDKLRERQRASLVAYLLAHPDAGHPWRDTNDVYAHLLIDVEMSPCQMTSRIKQAISSVQLFVQRCLMNLEQNVIASAEVDPAWLEWKWMKNYRVWEANRKVFLYPENWIEPELRDDKSPFFTELGSALMQADLTKDAAEDALREYLAKLDTVARLEVVGEYHEVETSDGTPSGDIILDVLHVFARTRGTTKLYFYRRRIDSSYWTAWEPVDLDLEGDHIVPLVWNRRLYLTWAVFTEETQEVSVTFTLGSTVSMPPKRWKVQLASSEYKSGKWRAKNVSESAIVFRWRVNNNLKKDFFFKGAATPEAAAIHCYRFSSLYTDVRYKGSFVRSGCNGDFVAGKESKLDFLAIPPGMRPQYTMLLEQTQQMRLPRDNSNYSVALDKTPGTYRLLYAHQENAFEGLRSQPFFFQDATKVFFVIPAATQVWKPTPGVIIPDPGLVFIPPKYYDPLPDPLGPIWNPGDIMIDPSQPVLADLPQTGPAIDQAIQGGGFGPPAFETRSSGGAVGAAAGGSPIQSFRFAGVARMQRVLPAASTPMALSLGKKQSARLDYVTQFVMAQATYVAVGSYHTEWRYQFQAYYHPYLCEFVKQLNRDGVDGLMQRPVQLLSKEFFDSRYDASVPIPGLVKTPYPVEDVDFDYDGAYSLYNWELFFHVPLLIANRLSLSQRFEDAQNWFHYIFDPTDTSSFPSPKRFWRTKPFFITTDEQYRSESIPNMLRFLAKQGDPAEYAKLNVTEKKQLDELAVKVKEWRKNPFMPHLVARLRTTAYQKTVVMKYLDNLIGWGDRLFRRDTLESINEATQLYILAAEILGKRPQEIPERAVPQVQTFNSIEPRLDDFSNALVQVEDFVPPSAAAPQNPGNGATPSLPNMLYFCVPKNDKLLGYWDTVADRLFKIRHCQNIEGIERQLPLFEAPIDPAMLVRAVAAGIDIDSALNDMSAALPPYRFTVMAQRASDLAGELKGLGASLLSALEKRDTEQMAIIQARQQSVLLDLVMGVKSEQQKEASENLNALVKGREMTASRYAHYQKLLGVPSPAAPAEGVNPQDAPPSPLAAVQDSDGVKLISHEQTELNKLSDANAATASASDWDFAASIANMVPTVNAQPIGCGISFGGSNVGSGFTALATRDRNDATQATYESTRSSRVGQAVMREHEWLLQSNQALRDLAQIDKQVAAARLRVEVAKKEIASQRKQIEHAKETEEFLRSKYTNQELYTWMIGQISTVYFQAYQLAYDIAKKAERAYQHELGLRTSSFIQFGYWDSLRKGLFAGERLAHDIRRMEVSYLEQNKRLYEITRHVSLSQMDPVALIQLRQTGECILSVPEALYDLDFPGHYMRRIKSVGVTIPCVTGPYTGVPCTLSLLRHTVRHSGTLLAGKYTRQAGDPRFADGVGPIESIATSSGQNDSGMFETDLRADRFLPFEGAGAVSEWKIALPSEFRPFDFSTISDVVLQIRYTAKNSGGSLRQQAVSELRAALNQFSTSGGDQGLARLISVRHEFPSEWSRFRNPVVEGADQSLTISLAKDRFPFLFERRNLQIQRIELYMKVRSDVLSGYVSALQLIPAPAGSPAVQRGLIRAAMNVNIQPGPAGPAWNLTMFLDDGAGGHIRLDPDNLEDLFLVCRYSIG